MKYKQLATGTTKDGSRFYYTGRTDEWASPNEADAFDFGGSGAAQRFCEISNRMTPIHGITWWSEAVAN